MTTDALDLAQRRAWVEHHFHLHGLSDAEVMEFTPLPSENFTEGFIAGMEHGTSASTSLLNMNGKDFDETILRAIQIYGKETQTQMMFEEMSELQDALCKLFRGRDTVGHVCEEIADVMIMCFQMAQIYGPAAVEYWAQFKMNRLKERLEQKLNEPQK